MKREQWTVKSRRHTSVQGRGDNQNSERVAKERLLGRTIEPRNRSGEVST